MITIRFHQRGNLEKVLVPFRVLEIVLQCFEEVDKKTGGFL
tara:strand:+ start:224 stop:346 length:123 start_codon:yes stop_codon:yes gene_type:complete